jgi:hypothetical protein
MPCPSGFAPGVEVTDDAQVLTGLESGQVGSGDLDVR